MSEYRCYKCESIHTTENMAACCATCFSASQSEVEALREDRRKLLDAIAGELPDIGADRTVEMAVKELAGLSDAWDGAMRLALKEREAAERRAAEAERKNANQAMALRAINVALGNPDPTKIMERLEGLIHVESKLEDAERTVFEQARVWKDALARAAALKTTNDLLTKTLRDQKADAEAWRQKSADLQAQLARKDEALRVIVQIAETVIRAHAKDDPACAMALNRIAEEQDALLTPPPPEAAKPPCRICKAGPFPTLADWMQHRCQPEAAKPFRCQCGYPGNPANVHGIDRCYQCLIKPSAGSARDGEDK